MTSVMKMRFEHPRDLINFVLGALLFASPWLLGFAAEPVAAWTAWGTGAVIAAVSIAALFIKSAAWPESVGLVLGVWTVASPWIAAFTTVTLAFWAHLAVGILLAVIAAWEVWTDFSHEPATT